MDTNLDGSHLPEKYLNLGNVRGKSMWTDESKSELFIYKRMQCVRKMIGDRYYLLGIIPSIIVETVF